MQTANRQTLKTEISANRDYLHDHEIEAMLEAVKKSGSRHALRNATLILIAFRHGLRAEEITRLLWTDIDLKSNRQYTINVTRVKNSDSGVHPLREEEIRMLKRLKSENDSPYVFASQKGGPLTTRMVHNVVREAGELAKLSLPVHPHMLRHSAGFAMANAGVDTRAIQEFLGHRNIQNTVRYTKLAAGRFNQLIHSW